MAILQRILYIVGRENRRRMAWVLFLAILVALFDFVSIGGLFPLLNSALAPDAAGATAPPPAIPIGLPAWLPLSTTALAGVVLLLFVTKAVVTSYSFREGFRFTYDVQVSIAVRMLRGLFGRDYEYFLSQNSAVLLKNLTAEVQYFAGSVVLSVFYVISQGLIIVTIGVLLALVSPTMAIAAFLTIGLLTTSMYFLVSRRVTVWGKEREARLSDLNRIAHEALSGIKAVKANAVEHEYLARFETVGLEYARLNTRYQNAGAVPPIAIEFLLFGGVTTIVLIYSWRGLSLAGVLPLLAVFGAAAYRLLPAMKNLYSYLVTIRYYATTVRVLEDMMRSTERSPVLRAPAASTHLTRPISALTESIALSGIDYSYPEAERSALRGIDLQIAAGTHLAVIGGSGSGKTTLIDVVLGLLVPSGGTVAVDGVTLTRDNEPTWRAQLGYVSQHIFLADATLRENVAFGVAPSDVDDVLVAEVLRQTHLIDLVSRLPQGLKTPVGENGARLSGGERQRLGIARALYRRPRVLVLDEATSALDTLTERAVNNDVLEACRGITVIIVAHRLSTVRHCDKLVLMRHGEIEAVGTYDELLEQSAMFAEMHEQSVS